MSRGRFGQVETSIWTDDRFLGLSPNAQLLWLFLLSSPNAILPGVVVAGPATIGETIRRTTDEVKSSLIEIQNSGLGVQFDLASRLIWVVNSLRDHPPANHFQAKGWARFWNEVPNCELKATILESLVATCETAALTWKAPFNARELFKPVAFKRPENKGNVTDRDGLRDRLGDRLQDGVVDQYSLSLSVSPILDSYSLPETLPRDPSVTVVPTPVTVVPTPVTVVPTPVTVVPTPVTVVPTPVTVVPTPEPLVLTPVVPLASKRKGARRVTPAHPLPDDWRPSAEHENIAAERGADCALEARKMRAWAEANGITRKKWDSQFETWLLNNRQYSHNNSQNNSQNRISPLDVALAAANGIDIGIRPRFSLDGVL